MRSAPETALLLRVHPSNFRVVGFTDDVPRSRARRRSAGAAALPVVDDLGSGPARARPGFAGEPDARTAIADGATLICCSGDKLLGGPQAGIVAGTTDAVERVRRHPLARAVRIGKLAVAALEATLRLHRDPAVARAAIPVLRMAHDRPRRPGARRAPGGRDRRRGVATEARVGGGSMPDVALPVERRGALRRRARRAGRRRSRPANPPVVGRVEDGRLLLDARTLADDDVAGGRRDAVRAARG